MTRQKSKGLSAIHVLGILVFGGIAALLIFGETDSQKRAKQAQDTAKHPTDISGLSNKIIGIAQDEKHDATEIILRQSSVWNEESVVFVLASEANDISKGIQQNFKSIKTPTIRFTIEIPLVDKFGNSSSTRVMSINYKTSDIYTINYTQGFEPQQFLDLYESAWYVDQIAHKLVNSFCISEVGKSAMEFCRRERLGRGEK